MESKSQNQAYRRHRGNRSGGRGRNRQGNQSSQGGKASGGRQRNRNRNRSGSGSKPPKQTPLQKFLSAITFGLLGKPKAKSAPKAGNKSARPSESARTPKGAGNATPTEANKPKRNRAEVTSGRLYVGNLDYATGEAELEELFNGVGSVLSAEVVTNPRTQQSKGFAFVEMGSIEEARRAVSILDDQEFMGRKLVVSGARSDGPNEEGGESALAGSASENHA